MKPEWLAVVFMAFICIYGDGIIRIRGKRIQQSSLWDIGNDFLMTGENVTLSQAWSSVDRLDMVALIKASRARGVTHRIRQAAYFRQVDSSSFLLALGIVAMTYPPDP